MNRYRLDPNQLPADMVRYVGVEMLPPEGRKLAAASAARQAQENGIQRLPLAEMGQPYEFAVRSMDGQLFRSAELRGSVVVIHCWDDGNASSLTQREVLRTLYERRHAEGLAVLGAHLNGQSSKPETLEPTIRPPWPEMQVPNDPFARGLWVQASEILALPRMLILDRQGILRADSPPDWQDSIDRLLGKR